MVAQKRKKLKIAVLCGGPSGERGISLNSARSVCDHLEGEDFELYPFFLDLNCKPYRLSRSQLYCNTPSDFDFKLKSESKALSQQQFVRELRKSDIVFPTIHGRYGEDGTLQKFLEKHKIPFIGASSNGCVSCFDKYNSAQSLQKLGFDFVPSFLVLSRQLEKVASKNFLKKELTKFFKENSITRAIVKPAVGGSSLGVHSVETVSDAIDKAELLATTAGHKRVVVEPFCKGVEFTSIILQNKFDLPICLLPVEIEADYFGHQIFDYRKKYLPSRQVAYHCPARFKDPTLETIATRAEALFKHFGLRDFARFDGWLLENGKIVFTDFNPISGMEQNSFLFLQAARIGMSHKDVLHFVVASACRRYGIRFPELQVIKDSKHAKKDIPVLFGGATAERQVSLMSGTNVWLKLRGSKKFNPIPYFLDTESNVWKLPYGYALNHTVEEIVENCKKSEKLESRLEPLRNRVRERLFIQNEKSSISDFLPTKVSIQHFLNQQDYVFLGLHGGIGENGTIQNMLSAKGAKFNGSHAKAAMLCMDKYETGITLQKANISGVLIPSKLSIPVIELLRLSPAALKDKWQQISEGLSCESVVVKPQDDGCSAGVVKLAGFEDLQTYIKALRNNENSIPAGRLKGQSGTVEMPTQTPKQLLFEQFIETDKVSIEAGKLIWQHKTGWIEVTVGVLGKKGKMKSMSPSITVASGSVLSLEEKFQGGTGVNITPPPEKYVSKKVLNLVKSRIEQVANALGIENYARLDTFINIKTGELCFIEANTLPGLTPSTVIYHQALEETPLMYPREFLERIIELSNS